MVTTATVLALASVAVAAAGTAVSTYGAIQQGEQQQKAANFNRQVALNNATASQQQSEFDAQRIRRRNVLLAGRQRASAAKSGVDLTGSMDDVMFDTSVQGELDAMAALYTGQVTSNRERAQGQLYQMRGDAAGESAMWNAGGTILTGAGQGLGIYSNYMRDQQPRFPGRGRA